MLAAMLGKPSQMKLAASPQSLRVTGFMDNFILPLV
jgi:hypothetical protein